MCRILFSEGVNPFYAIVSFLFPLKTSDNQFFKLYKWYQIAQSITYKNYNNFKIRNPSFNGTKLIVTCSKSIIEILPKDVICSKLIIFTPERHQWRRSAVFIVNFEHILHLSLVFSIVDFKQVNFSWEGSVKPSQTARPPVTAFLFLFAISYIF